MQELLGIHIPPPREDFAIKEVFVDSVLRKDPLPHLDYSFNPYIGCYHGCTFCYSPRLLRTDRRAGGGGRRLRPELGAAPPPGRGHGTPRRQRRSPPTAT